MSTTELTFANDEQSTVVHELKRAQQLIDQFVYRCSHDLRAPIKSIEGLVMLAMQSKSQDESNQYVQLIENTSHKMDRILNELEDFLTLSKHEVASEEINLNYTVENAVRSYLRQIDDKKIHFSVDVKQAQTFWSDSARVKVVLTHLIANAVTFSDTVKQRPFIHIEAAVTKQGCSIKIRDNGIGIPTQAKPHIFSVFYKASEKSKGAGLGLFVARQALEKMGGFITVDSVENEGSQFMVWLPNKTK